MDDLVENYELDEKLAPKKNVPSEQEDEEPESFAKNNDSKGNKRKLETTYHFKCFGTTTRILYILIRSPLIF